jgi:hypothetical protein
MSLERIYMGFIRPLLEYGDIIWDSPLEIIQSLERIQLDAARVVVGATARSPTEGLYTETSWETLANRRTQHRKVMMFRIVNGLAPNYLANLVPNLVGNRTRYGLRNRGNLDPPTARLNVYANSFFPKTTHLWNSLGDNQRNLPSVDAFKANHKRSLPKTNPIYYYGNRFESMIHARMRMGNSPLNEDLNKRLHVIPSPLCVCGGGKNEDAKHFFFECPLFTDQRVSLKTNLLPHVITNKDYLLFGLPDTDHATNLHIFSAVHKYFKDTERFS